VALSVTATISGFGLGENYSITHAFGSVWVSHRIVGDRAISRIDPATNTITATIAGMGSTTVDLTFDGTYIFAKNFSANTVKRIDPTTNTVTGTYTTTNFAYGLATGDGSVWVSAGSGVNSIERVDPATMLSTATIATAQYPYGLHYAFGSLWAGVSTATMDVIRINPSTNAVTATIAAGAGGNIPYVIRSDNTAIWVARTGTNAMLRIDPTTNTLTDTLLTTGSAAPDGIGVDTTYNKVWVSYSSQINRIDLAGGIFTDGASHL
jgi:DNA-binding beta-propeller fold protein YncE